MLLSSVLRMLDHYRSQSQEPAWDEAACFSAESGSGLGKIGMETAAAAGSLRPNLPEERPKLPVSAAQRLKELHRVMTEVEKPVRSPLLDVFE